MPRVDQRHHHDKNARRRDFIAEGPNRGIKAVKKKAPVASRGGECVKRQAKSSATFARNSTPPAEFPAGWYEIFEKNLKTNISGDRVLRDFLPNCDARAIGILAMRYVQNASGLADRRKRRGIIKKAELRKRAQQLRSELTAEAEESKVLELRYVQFQIEHAYQAFATKRHGVSGNHLELLLLSEYLRLKTGLTPGPTDLAVILKAAKKALGWREEVLYVDAGSIRHNLKNFEKNSPKACALLRELLPHMLATVQS
jgi:hypothetical protein